MTPINGCFFLGVDPEYDVISGRGLCVSLLGRAIAFMERTRDLETLSSGWKPVILAFELDPHGPFHFTESRGTLLAVLLLWDLLNPLGRGRMN